MFLRDENVWVFFVLKKRPDLSKQVDSAYVDSKAMPLKIRKHVLIEEVVFTQLGITSFA